MIQKALDKIVKADVDELIATQRIEDRRIEYKQKLPGNADDEKREFLADISSFANSLGGDILFGVDEREGLPVSASGLALGDFDAERLRLLNLIRDGIDPRIPAVEIAGIPGFPDGHVVLVRVHQSWTSPHMVTFKNLSRFYVRAAGQRQQMDTQELRAAFAGMESAVARVRAFRDDRIGRVLTGRTPVTLWDHPTIVLHVLPIGGAFSENAIEPRLLSDRWQLLNRSDFVRPAVPRYNLEGLLICTGQEGERRSRAYMQLFRNGGVEAVATYSRLEEPLTFFSGQFLERQIASLVDDVRRFYASEHLEAPLSVTLSLLRFSGVAIMTSSALISLADHRVYDRETFILPDIILYDSSADTGRACRPVFDALWQAAGFMGSPSYDDRGGWHAPQT